MPHTFCPGTAAASANAAYYLHGEAFGLRQLAAAFKRILEKQAYWAVFKSGSKLPHSQGALRAQKLCGIMRDAGVDTISGLSMEIHISIMT